MYQLNASAIQSLLTQATAAAGGSARGGSREDNKDDRGSNFIVLKCRMLCGLEDTPVNKRFPKWYMTVFAKHLDEKYKS